jgi:hypothetical protein
MHNMGRTRGVKLTAVVRKPAFRQGFDHYRRGVEPLFDAPEKIRGRSGSSLDRIWAYERGRLFAAWCRGKGIQLDPKAWFVRRRLSWNVENTARQAYWDGVFR